MIKEPVVGRVSAQARLHRNGQAFAPKHRIAANMTASNAIDAGVLFWRLVCYQQCRLGDVIFRNGEWLPIKPRPVFL